MIKKRKREIIDSSEKSIYNIWGNGRLFSIILIGISILFFVLSIIEIPFLSAIPGYTIGFFLGYYSYIFYIFLIYYASCKLFNINIFLIKIISKVRVFHYSWLNITILTLGVMLIVETSMYISNGNPAFPGINAWSDNFNLWWTQFTSFNDALKPSINNLGIIASFILSLLNSIGGTIITILIAILLISYFVFYTFYSSPIKNLGLKKQKKIKDLDIKNEHETKIIDLTFEDEHKIVVTEFGNKIIGEVDINHQKNEKFRKTKMLKDVENIEKEERNKNINKTKINEVFPDETSDETIPFDNPFEEGLDSFISSENITSEIKMKYDPKFNDDAIVFDNVEKHKNGKPNVYNETKNIIIEEKKKKRT